MTSQDDTNKLLDVDQFHHSIVIEPGNPVRYEATLTPGKEDGELYFINFEYELAKGKDARDPSEYKAKAPTPVGGQGAHHLADSLRLRDVSVTTVGNDVMITGYPQ